jgi:2-polyprenyl-3-methyl-5-hydroxy-6-metoxy-1,4-benzoquinol methylase
MALQGSRYRRVRPWLRGSLLEVGCGWSALPDALPPEVTDYAGCDIDHDVIMGLSAIYPQFHFVTVDLDMEPLPEGSGPYDTILATAVIEHLFNLRSVTERLTSVLKPGGRIVLTTPTPIGNDLVLPITSALRLTSKSAHDDHISILNRKRFLHLTREVGLRLVRYERFQFGLNSLAVLERPSPDP